MLKQRWGRRYLTLDRYMSGDFWHLFRNTLVISVGVFFILCVLTYYVAGWNPGEAFVQLTNPTRHDGGANPVGPQEWIGIVIMNLFGFVVLNGVILTLLVNWVSNRKDRHTNGQARYDYVFSRKYSVIIGGYRIVSSLADDLLMKRDNEYVVIQTQRDVERLRKEIYARINDEKVARNVIIYSGDRTSWHELEELNLASAKEVFIIGEMPYIDGSSHDALNLQCWDLINRHITRAGEQKIPCHIMFEYQSTFSAFQYTDLKLEHSVAFRFIPFSIYENWAQQVLIPKQCGAEPYYLPIDGVGGLGHDSRQRVHLIVLGMSKMGVALAMEAAHIAHYPNFNNPETGRPRTLITFVDRNARREMMFLMGRYRELFQLARWRYVKAPDAIIRPDDGSWDIYDTSSEINGRSNRRFPWHDPMKDPDFRSPYHGGYLGENLVDVDFEFIEGDVALPSIQKYLSDACGDNASEVSDGVLSGSSRTTIAVCFPIAAEAMSAALYFEPSVYENVQQLWVLQQDSGALAETVRYGLTGQDEAKFSKLRPFGMIDRCDYLERSGSLLPKLVAYAYDCLDRDTTLEAEYQKSVSREEFLREVEAFWISITAEGGKSAIAKRWSNVYCANSFSTKARAVRLADSGVTMNPELVGQLAEVEHNRWVLEQLLLGIRPVDSSFAGTLPVRDKGMRSSLKRRNVHPDLVSNKILGTARSYDEEIARIIPLAYSIADNGVSCGQKPKAPEV